MTTGSLAYRKNQQAIWDGHVPSKYTRLLPYITGRSVLEIGAAEGVLALTLAARNPHMAVTGLELRPDRHQASLDLRARWRSLGRSVDRCRLICGDIREHLDLLEGVETFVAIRTIYYLRESIASVFEAIAAKVPAVVLCGNPNRAREFAATKGANALGRFNYYAGVDGMTDVLTRVGYTINAVVREGDPIVTGHR